MRSISNNKEVDVHGIAVRNGAAFKRELRNSGKLISVFQEMFPAETILWEGRFAQRSRERCTTYLVKNTFLHEKDDTPTLKRTQSDSRLLEKETVEWKSAAKKKRLPQPL